MKKIILTIDDGPSDYFKELLDYLIKSKHKAIFFCRGNCLEEPKNEKLIIKAIKKGFLLGNHSYSHPNFNFISFQKGKEEILRTDRIISHLYKKAKINQETKLFRFPSFREGGINFFNYQKLLKKLGYKNPYHKKNYFWVKSQRKHFIYHLFQSAYRGKYDVYCDIDPADYSKKTTKDMAISVVKNAKKEDIIDLHDMEHSVKNLIPSICNYLKKEGFTLAY